MIGLLTASIEHIYTAVIFLLAACFSFGTKRPAKYAYPSILLAAICIAVINIPFFGSHIQRQGYIVVLLIVAAVYSLVFINAPIIYVMSLLLNLFGCFSLSKELIFSILRLYAQSPMLSSSQERVFTIAYILSMLAFSAFFIFHALLPRIQQPMKYWFAMLAIPIIVLLVSNLFSQGYDFSDWQVDSSRILIDALLLSLLLLSHYLSFLNVNSYNEMLDSHTINQRMALQLHSIESSAALVDQIRNDKHEMKNIFFYLHTLLEEDKTDQLAEFVNTKLLHRYDRLEEFSTGNDTLDYLLSQKASEARAKGITFMADIQSPIDLSIDPTDLCALLLNLLDNAIEASEKISTPDIRIKIEKQKSYLSITIKNRADTQSLKKNKDLLTTKLDPANHGIGLRIVRQVVKKYDGMFQTNLNEGYFTVNTMLRLS